MSRFFVAGITLFSSTCCFIAFIILLLLKVDSDYSRPWYTVFLPLWISFLFYSWFIGWLFVRKLSGRSGRIGALMWLELAGLCFVLFTILLSMRLENATNTHWIGIFSPFWCGCLLLMLVDPHWPEYKHEFHTRERRSSDDHVIESYIEVLPMNALLSIIVFTIILGFSLEGTGITCKQGTWPICFAPFWYLCGVFFLLFLTNLSMRMDRPNHAIVEFILSIPWWVTIILVLLYLEGIIGLLTYCFIPFFLVSLVWLLASCALCCCIHF